MEVSATHVPALQYWSVPQDVPSATGVLVSVHVGHPGAWGASQEIACRTHWFRAGSLHATPGMHALKSQVAVALPLGPQLIV
jgi:hypothetical protein